MLTDKAVRAAAARDKAYKLTDSRGLHLHISGNGHKSWRYKYRFEKKERLLTLGTYPEVSLAEAREKRDEAKKVLREGRDPRHAVKRGRLVGDGGGVEDLRGSSSRMAWTSIGPLEAGARQRCHYQPRT